MRRLLPVLIGAVAIGAFLLPSAAFGQAKNATHNGVQLSKSVTVTGSGTASFTSAQGGMSCSGANQEVLLEPGSTGKSTGIGLFQTSSCTYSGVLDTLCGVVDKHEATGLPYVGHGTKTEGKYTIVVTDIHLHGGGTGIFCPDITLSGDVFATPDNPHSISSFTLSGSLESNLGSNVTVSGEVSGHPAKTYGFET